MDGPTDLETFQAALADVKTEIIEEFDAQGVGIGRTAAKDGYVVVVYLAEGREAASLPEAFAGLPLRFEVTGEFSLQKEPPNKP